MPPKPTSRLLLGALLLLLSPASSASAETSPDAQKWLTKLIAIYEQGPFQVDYEADLDMSGLGQPLSGKLSGKLTQADRSHSRVELQIDMANPPGMDSGGMSVSLLNVTDGTIVWTEMDNPALGGRQVTKVTLADLEELGDAMGGLGASPTSMDPVAQLETLTNTMDFEVREEADDHITLWGKITEETRAKLGMLSSPGVEGFVFIIDKQTGFPTEVRAGGETPFVTMHFRNLKFLDAASLPDGLFTYSPPEGLPVMDLGPVLRSQVQ